MISALVLIGPPGAGKSSVLDALGTLLELDGVEHGSIESEELARGFPGLSNALLVRQLAAVLSLQRRAGRTLFVVAFTAESAGELRAVVEATGAERALVVHLSAAADVLAQRLERREPDRWPGKARLIAHARELAVRVPALPGAEMRIDTAGRDAEDVAAEIVAAMRRRDMLGPADSA
jgi:broad-specificity NMP kinase